MNKLKTELSCEVDDMIRCIARDTGKDYAVVEFAMFKECIYPENGKTFVSTKFLIQDPKDSWLMDGIKRILNENGIESIYITNAI
jgi:hypothetical protein